MPTVIKREKRISMERIRVAHGAYKVVLDKVPLFAMNVNDNAFGGFCWLKEDTVKLNSVKGVGLMKRGEYGYRRAFHGS